MEDTAPNTPGATGAAESPTAAAPSAASETAAPPASEAVSSSAPPAAPIAESVPAVAPETPTTTDTPAPAAAAGKEPTSLLGDAAPAPEPTADAKATDPKAEAKPGDPAAEAKDGKTDAPAEGDAPASEAPPEEAPLPTYDVFTVPEGVELDDTQVDTFVGALGSTERAILAAAGDPAKVHAAVQDLGQQLLDQYTAEMAGLDERIRQNNADTFGRTMETWKNEFFNDPVIGGNRKDTTLANARRVIDRFGGTPQERAELRGVFNSTGAGNHRLVLNIFNNIAEFLGEGRAVPGDKPEPLAASRKDRRYGKGN